VVLMGGVGRQGGDLALNYNWLMHNDITVRGKWMYPRDAIPGWCRWSAPG
jgi:alcohol dehydrogenase